MYDDNFRTLNNMHFPKPIHMSVEKEQIEEKRGSVNNEGDRVDYMPNNESKHAFVMATLKNNITLYKAMHSEMICTNERLCEIENKINKLEKSICNISETLVDISLSIINNKKKLKSPRTTESPRVLKRTLSLCVPKKITTKK